MVLIFMLVLVLAIGIYAVCRVALLLDWQIGNGKNKDKMLLLHAGTNALILEEIFILVSIFSSY